MNRLKDLRKLCIDYDFDNANSFFILLHETGKIFPNISMELANVYNLTVDTVYLWAEGCSIPDNLTQVDVINYIQHKIDNFSEMKELEEQPAELIIYNSRVPAVNIASKYSISSHLMLRWRSIWNSFKALFYYKDIDAQNLDALIKEAKEDREALFNLKLSKKIAKCNKAIVQAVRKNQPNIVFKVGSKTIENVRIANAIKTYLKDVEIDKVQTMLEQLYITDGLVYVEINLQ